MKKIANILKITLLTVFILSMLACSKEKTSGGVNVIKNPAKDPTRIVTQSNYIAVDNSKNAVKIYASVIPVEQADEPLEFSSSNQTVAQVDNTGNVSISGEGIANISVRLKNDKTIYKNIIVNSYTKAADEADAGIRAVFVNTTYISLMKGGTETYNLDAGIRPIDAQNQELAYISTDTNVVSVDETGVVNAVNEGTAVVVVYSKADPSRYVQVTVDVTGQPSSGDSGISFTPPAGVSEIDFAGNPLSLIAKYQVLEYKINNQPFQAADADSNLRVNVILDALPVVDIIMYTKLNGKEVRLTQRKDINDYNRDIGAIFTSLGANITGKYTMEFTLKPEVYSQFYKQGVVSKGDTLVLRIGKVEDYIAATGLGSDVVFDPALFPVEEGTSGEDTGGNSGEETGGGVEVSSVNFDVTSYVPYKVNEKFLINATVLPENADNKTLTWASSNESIATVDSSGNVTIHSNGNAKITATAHNGVMGELTIMPNQEVIDFALDIDKYDLILGLVDEYKITYSLYPYIISPDTVTPSFSSDNSQIATVSEDGTIRAVSEGETIIRVTIAGIEREFFVTVLPSYAANTPVESISLASESGLYNLKDGSFRLSASVEPPTAADKRLRFVSLNTQVAEVGETSGVVTLRNTGTAIIRVSAFNDDSKYADYSLTVETTPTQVIFERLDYGILLNEEKDIPVILEGNPSNRNVVYSSSNPDIATVDELTGRVTAYNLGTTTITAVAENGMQDSYDLHVYTPADINNLSSLQGTYDIMDFTQVNGTLNVGTKEYGGVERMLGEVTIKVEGNKVYMTSKIQMNSSELHGYSGIGDTEAKTGLFQTVVFEAADFKAGGFGSTGSLTKGQVSSEGDTLKIYQQFDMTVFITVTVKVNTWIKKKSNTVKNLDPNVFIWTKDGANYNTKAHATNYFNASAPAKEPYYAYGLIVK